ncbi:uncharacterized protein K489DRAFT_383500 [Dissoconium aciculare CBS 342.82]|uniref:Secreted protein n=1 Tax=Dissoconium aciculare CBS 342.82 TaxID=1314786 RepID=A0A6J3LVZ6_9PEZI|nr:uncharacterized protein K489DRAFT_383500 [Dissoconium aciculare CBS 342.82]KAF1819945.1 hypothetical protein K489DRAFT_383500 [Dissoconium aciculare CBS 342.82]
MHSRILALSMSLKCIAASGKLSSSINGTVVARSIVLCIRPLVHLSQFSDFSDCKPLRKTSELSLLVWSVR